MTTLDILKNEMRNIMSWKIPIGKSLPLQVVLCSLKSLVPTVTIFEQDVVDKPSFLTCSFFSQYARALLVLCSASKTYAYLDFPLCSHITLRLVQIQDPKLRRRATLFLVNTLYLEDNSNK